MLSAAGDDPFDLDMAMAALQSSVSDVHMLLKVLVAQLSDVLGSRLHVQRAGRFRRSDQVKAVQVSLGDDVLEAEVDGGSVRCTVGHASGGIRIRTEQVDMAGWLKTLLGALHGEAVHSERTREALERLMIGGTS